MNPKDPIFKMILNDLKIDLNELKLEILNKLNRASLNKLKRAHPV